MTLLFSGIDRVLKQTEYFLSCGFTALIRYVVDLFGANSSFLNSEHYKNAVNFFFYDSMKIFLTLTVIIFIVSLVRSFFPPEKTKKLLGEGKLEKPTQNQVCSKIDPSFVPIALTVIPLVTSLSNIILDSGSVTYISKTRCISRAPKALL